MDSKSKFLLLAPKSFGLYKLIVKNLEYLGYEVEHIEDTGYDFKYTSFRQRVYNFIRKVFLNDKKFKSNLRKQFKLLQQIEILKRKDRYDILLVIRADFFDHELIAQAVERSNKSLSFHYDGIGRDTKILDYINYFTAFYVFDEADLKYDNGSQNLRYSPNFYFDYPGLIEGVKLIEEYNVYYVSTFHPSRVSFLITIYQLLNSIYEKVKFVVVCEERNRHLIPDIINQNMEVTYELVPFEKQLAYISKANVIVDLVISEHNGFSFRLIEGLKFRKKVITTNKRAVLADFYHPHNIFVLTEDNHSDLRSFLELPYVDLPEQLVIKYGFQEWLNSKKND